MTHGQPLAVRIDDSAQTTAQVTAVDGDRMTVRVGERDVDVQLDPADTAAGASTSATTTSGPAAIRRGWVDGKRVTFHARRKGATWQVYVNGVAIELEIVAEQTQRLREIKAAAGLVRDTKIKAPMPGLVLATGVEPGEVVEKGAVICVLEAMKMQNEIRASNGGVIKERPVVAGQTVARGDLLAVIAPSE